MQANVLVCVRFILNIVRTPSLAQLTLDGFTFGYADAITTGLAVGVAVDGTEDSLTTGLLKGG
jgi:hypothetical protein